MFVSLLLVVAFGRWNDHVLDWWKHEDDPNVLFLKYEDLKKVCCYISEIILTVQTVRID